MEISLESLCVDLGAQDPENQTLFSSHTFLGQIRDFAQPGLVNNTYLFNPRFHTMFESFVPHISFLNSYQLGKLPVRKTSLFGF